MPALQQLLTKLLQFLFSTREQLCISTTMLTLLYMQGHNDGNMVHVTASPSTLPYNSEFTAFAIQPLWQGWAKMNANNRKTRH